MKKPILFLTLLCILIVVGCKTPYQQMQEQGVTTVPTVEESTGIIDEEIIGEGTPEETQPAVTEQGKEIIEEQQVSTEPEPPAPSASEPITLSRESIITQPKKSEVLKVGVYNPTSQSWNSIKPTISCNNLAILSETNSKNIGQGESAIFNFLVNIPYSIEGAYLCQVTIKEGYSKDFVIKLITSGELSSNGGLYENCLEKYNIKNNPIIFVHSNYDPHTRNMMPIIRELESGGYKFYWAESSDSKAEEIVSSCFSNLLSGYVPQFICPKTGKEQTGEISKDELKRFYSECEG